ncbi:DNA methyltransferase [Shewanella woodyi]|uniref:DNA methyltransferase n=1 Tax=Shewanella woodyi TaxID=60961 RepID=UPI0007F86AB2|nr:DNA methyltransferase [Shewanella woodyi]
MSSTIGNKVARDNYPTPVNTVEALLNNLTLRPNDKFLEPCRGTRNIFDRISLPSSQKYWAEIEEGVDYLSTNFGQQDVIITNPPFSLTIEFIKKSLSELAPDGTLAYLQRVNFLGSKCRVDFWEEIGFPNKTPVIIPRPRFVNGGSDSCEYMWMIWDRGNRFSNIPNGISHIISK